MVVCLGDQTCWKTFLPWYHEFKFLKVNFYQSSLSVYSMYFASTVKLVSQELQLMISIENLWANYVIQLQYWSTLCLQSLTREMDGVHCKGRTDWHVVPELHWKIILTLLFVYHIINHLYAFQRYFYEYRTVNITWTELWGLVLWKIWSQYSILLALVLIRSFTSVGSTGSVTTDCERNLGSSDKKLNLYNILKNAN